MEEQKFGSSVKYRLVPLPLVAESVEPTRADETYHCLIDDVLEDGFFRESWRGDDDHLERVEVKVTHDSSVYLGVEAEMCLTPHQHTSNESRSHLVRAEGCPSTLALAWNSDVDALSNDGCMVRDEADVGHPLMTGQRCLLLDPHAPSPQTIAPTSAPLPGSVTSKMRSRAIESHSPSPLMIVKSRPTSRSSV